MPKSEDTRDCVHQWGPAVAGRWLSINAFTRLASGSHRGPRGVVSLATDGGGRFEACFLVCGARHGPGSPLQRKLEGVPPVVTCEVVMSCAAAELGGRTRVFLGLSVSKRRGARVGRSTALAARVELRYAKQNPCTKTRPPPAPSRETVHVRTTTVLTYQKKITAPATATSRAKTVEAASTATAT